MFLMSPIGLLGACATLERDCFYEKGVFYSAEDNNEHTRRFPDREVGSKKAKAQLVQCLKKKKKNAIKMFGFIE